MRARLATVSVLLSAVLLAGCGPQDNGGSGSTPPGGSGEPASVADLIRDRCTRCHSIDRIKDAEHDRSAWDETISRMRGRGADVTDDDASNIAEFLAGGGGAEL